MQRPKSLLFVALLLSASLPPSPARAQATAAADITAHERLAQQYLRSHQPEQAMQEFQVVADADPRNLDAQANLGVLLYFAGKVSDAVPHLQTALALSPDQPRLQALLGFSEHRLGQLDAANKDLSAVFPKLTDPKIIRQTGLELVEIATAQNNLQQALPVIVRLRETLPTDPEVQFAAYRVYTDLAGESLLDLSLVAPDSAQMHQAMALELSRARDNDGAIANLRVALKADPLLPGAHFELAQALGLSSDPAVKAQAAAEYKLALTQNPTDDAALTQLGNLAADAGQAAEAIRYYKQALQIRPGNADASIGLAYQLSETGHPQEALPLLQPVLQADPTNLLAHYRLSAVYRRLHRPEDARQEVADYNKLRALKDKLRGVYEAMRVAPPAAASAPPATTSAAPGPGK